MPLNISGLNFFMPVFSFLFVFIVVYALLFKTKVLGESKWVLALTSLIIAVIFMSFSSMKLYVQTIIPWFVVLTVIVFFVLMLGMFTSKDWIPKSWLGWVVVGILILIFLIAAIRVFNPVLHPELIVTSGQNTSFAEQVSGYLDGGIFGSVLLLIIAGVVAWVITRK